MPDERPHRFERYKVTTFPYDDEDPPSRAAVFGNVWATDLTIVHLDNDVEVYDDHLDSILACPAPLCSWQFQLHWASGAPGNHLIQEDEGDGYGGYSPMGLVKVTPAARRQPWQMPHHWADTEMAMNSCVIGRWHLHGPAHRDPLTGAPQPQDELIHHHW